MKKHSGNYEVNLFYSKRSKSQYHNIIDKDPNRIAQILIDLMLEGYPIEEAIKRFNRKIEKQDWIGV